MMMRTILFLLLLSQVLFSRIYDYTFEPSSSYVSKYKAIKFLDSKKLKFDKINNIKVKELSGLAYRDKILYALGDKGVLFYFDIKIKDKKIKELSLFKALKLKNKKNKKLKKSHRDSEGLVFMDDKLLVSFEKKPRVEIFSLNAQKLKNKKIHKDLRNIQQYRGKNKGLEAVAYNLKYGVVTAPEISLESVSDKTHKIYTKKSTWEIASEGSLSALEFIDEDNLMILQRKLNMFSRRYVITLSMINLKDSKYTILTKLDSRDGWRLDNFEGLTKVSENQYLMISDDNNSFFQKTLLVLFELNL